MQVALQRLRISLHKYIRGLRNGTKRIAKLPIRFKSRLRVQYSKLLGGLMVMHSSTWELSCVINAGAIPTKPGIAALDRARSAIKAAPLVV